MAHYLFWAAAMASYLTAVASGGFLPDPRLLLDQIWKRPSILYPRRTVFPSGKRDGGNFFTSRFRSLISIPASQAELKKGIRLAETFALVAISQSASMGRC
jgi:hypothetical protein